MESENIDVKMNPPASSENIFSNKNFLIMVLLLLLIFSFLGINLLKNIGDFLQFIINSIAVLVKPIISNVLFITGVTIDKSSDILTESAKNGLDIGNGVMDSIGKLLIKSSRHDEQISKIPIEEPKKEEPKKIDETINKSNIKPPSQPAADSTTSPIQKSISSNKAGWCLIDEYKGQRNCIKVSELDKCMSGQVFPEQKMCLNPTLSK